MFPGKTLVIGCKSYIGKQFYHAYRKFYPDTLGTHYKSNDPTRKIDLLTPCLDDLRLKQGEYKWAIIAAANTNLSRCEEEKDLSFRANVEGTVQLLKDLKKAQITPIILSSDYVFDGLYGGYKEDSPKNPINEYGRQKALLEEMAPKICGDNYLIVRCSKIYGLNRGDNTLIDQIIEPLLQNRQIKAACDQFFAPIYEADVIRVVIKLQTLDQRGLFNLCGPEVLSRLSLAKTIGRLLAIEERLIDSISLDDLQIKYKLPKKTFMNCEKVRQVTGLNLTPLSLCLLNLSHQSDRLAQVKKEEECNISF